MIVGWRTFTDRWCQNGKGGIWSLLHTQYIIYKFILFFHLNLDRIPARLVLYFLSWSGFLVSFMMRNDINFAIVEMVRTNENLSNKTWINDATNSTQNNHSRINAIENGEFDWSSGVQSIVVGSFYWFYVLSQVKLTS